MTRRPIPLLAALALLLALGSCGDDDSKPKTVTTAPGPTGPTGSVPAPSRDSPGTSPPGGKREPARRAGPGAGAFDRSTVRVSFVNVSPPLGTKSAVAYFVAPGSDARRLAQAKACVQAFLAKAPSAYCFGFSSERAFRYSGVSRRPPARMRRACWSVYWGKPEARRPIGSPRNPAAEALRCPR